MTIVWFLNDDSQTEIFVNGDQYILDKNRFVANFEKSITEIWPKYAVDEHCTYDPNR